MHQRKLKGKMSEGADGHEGRMKIILETRRLQMIIAKPKAVFCYDITGKGTESIAQSGNTPRLIRHCDSLAHKLRFILDDGFKIGNTSFGEHWVKGTSADCM